MPMRKASRPVIVTIPRKGSEAQARSFLAEWRTSHAGTWMVTSEFRRRTAKGGDLRYGIRRGQRPPVELNVGQSVIERSDASSVTTCSLRPDGRFDCTTTAQTESVKASLDSEINTLGAYVLGRNPIYDVRSTNPDCWELTLLREFPASPYGNRAVFCFDHKTHAPIRTEIHRPEGTDTILAEKIVANPNDKDLALPGTVKELNVAG